MIFRYNELIVGLFFLSLANICYSQSQCEPMKDGDFVYAADYSEKVIYLRVKKSKITEYHEYGKYTIKSNIKWTSDCQYQATIKKVTIPNFPSKKGEQMTVKIDGIEDDKIFCTCIVGENTWKSVLLKIEVIPNQVVEYSKINSQ